MTAKNTKNSVIESLEMIEALEMLSKAIQSIGITSVVVMLGEPQDGRLFIGCLEDAGLCDPSNAAFRTKLGGVKCDLIGDGSLFVAWPVEESFQRSIQ